MLEKIDCFRAKALIKEKGRKMDKLQKPKNTQALRG